jgi:hypothetical protein
MKSYQEWQQYAAALTLDGRAFIDGQRRRRNPAKPSVR